MPIPVSNNGRRALVHRPFFMGACLLVLLLILPGIAIAERLSLSRVQAAADAGAPALALALLDRGQPSAADEPDEWFRWERLRLRILERESAWERALDHLDDLPPGAPGEARLWARERRAVLQLELGRPDAARAELRALVWRAGADSDYRDALPRWRRLIIRSYLADDRLDDAVTALRRYDQDHPDAGDGWPALRARVLLRSGRADEALAGLPSAPEDPELGALRLLAEVRSGSRSLESLLEEARALAETEGVRAIHRARFRVAAAEASLRQGAIGRHALLIEQAVADAAALPGDDALFAVTGDTLWQAWLQWGRRLGNEHQLLLGDDAGWIATAEEMWPRYRVAARALLAVVALEGHGENRDTAHARLLGYVEEDGPGIAAIRRLYLDTTRFSAIADIPLPARYRLIDDALLRDDIELATRLLADLDAAPEGRDPFTWRLLRARVLILGGEPLTGADVLDGVLDDHANIGGENMDRLMQVLFDLQGAREHERALELFRRIGERSLPIQRQRELLYWMAESHQALGNHREAAERYLESATLRDGRGGDPWGQTARYQAAGMLAEIGLVNDARRIYGVLLRVTEDPGRRAQLRNRLRELGLHELSPDDLPLREE